MPSNTEINPKNNTKDYKDINLRSGTKLKEIEMEKESKLEEEKEKEKDSKEKDIENLEENSQEKFEEVTKKSLDILDKPPPPFPNKLKAQNLDLQFSRFLDVFKKLTINIPFAEALEQMSSYAKFMKEILSKK